MIVAAKNIMRKSNLSVFAAFVLIYAALSYLLITFFYTDSLYFRTLSDQFAMERITRMIEVRRKWEWVGYVVFPLILLIKISFTAICLFISTFLSDLTLKWKDAFQIALTSEIVFILAGVVKLVYFLWVPPQAVDEISNFSPLSLAALIHRHVSIYLQYPLQTINLFEVGYCLLLAKGLQKVIHRSYGFNLVLVVRSYVAGLFVWVVAITFLLLQVS